MLKWIRIEPGEYEDSTGRFKISSTWDRIYGNHWELRDTSIKNKYEGLSIEPSLKVCKERAEYLVQDAISSKLDESLF